MHNNNIEPTLPLVGIEKDELIEFLFVNCPNEIGMGDFLNELEMFILCEYAANNRNRWEDGIKNGIYHFSEEELDDIENQDATISWFTINMFLGYRHLNDIGWNKMEGWERERYNMDNQPGRWYANYKENEDYVNAKKRNIYKSKYPSFVNDNLIPSLRGDDGFQEYVNQIILMRCN